MTSVEAKCSEEMVPVPPGMELHQVVTEQAQSWGLHLTERDGCHHVACGACGQSVLRLSRGGVYRWTAAELISGTVSHMIQRHEWTREGLR